MHGLNVKVIILIILKSCNYVAMRFFRSRIMIRRGLMCVDRLLLNFDARKYFYNGIRISAFCFSQEGSQILQFCFRLDDGKFYNFVSVLMINHFLMQVFGP